MKRNIDSFLKQAANHGFLTVDSNAPGMGYILDQRDKNRIMIVTGCGGGVILNRNQIRAISDEVREIMEVFTK